MKNTKEKNLYITVLIILCLVSLFLITFICFENIIKKTKHIPISDGLTNIEQIIFIDLS
jgi:hypothetical protein